MTEQSKEQLKIEPVPIRLAGVNIVVHPLANAFADFARDYIHEGPADFHVYMSEAAEKMKKEYGAEATVKAALTETAKPAGAADDAGKRAMPRNWNPRLAVYREIAERMPAYDAFLMHAVALSVDGNGYLFAAPSGTGKTTHTQMWAEQFGDRLVIINDDKPLIKIEDAAVTIHGTPWCGKERRNANLSAPLCAVFCLHRAEENLIAPIPSPEKAWDFLLHQIYRSRDPQVMQQILHLLGTLIARVPIYDLCCNTEPDAVATACAALGIF